MSSKDWIDDLLSALLPTGPLRKSLHGNIAHGKPAKLEHTGADEDPAVRIHGRRRHETHLRAVVEVDEFRGVVVVAAQAQRRGGDQEVLAQRAHVSKVGR